jgi:hypothetical protein
VTAGDPHLIGGECRLDAENAARPPLAGEAVADRGPQRIAGRLETELPTAASRFPRHALSLAAVARRPGAGDMGAALFALRCIDGRDGVPGLNTL